MDRPAVWFATGFVDFTVCFLGFAAADGKLSSQAVGIALAGGVATGGVILLKNSTVRKAREGGKALRDHHSRD